MPHFLRKMGGYFVVFIGLSAGSAFGGPNVVPNKNCAQAWLGGDALKRITQLTYVTGNESKWNQFSQLLADFKLKRIRFDLREVDADPLTVIVHKASQIPEERRGHIFFVTDSTLHVEGTNRFGTNTKWHVHEIGNYVGRRAHWVVFLAYRSGGRVFVYEGKLSGTIVHRRVEGPGFGPFFLPDGHTRTLAEQDYAVSARREVIKKLRNGQIFGIYRPIMEWQGPYQQES